MSNMKAELVMDDRYVLEEGVVAELVVWQLPQPLPASTHTFKYRLAYIVQGECVVRYDNEAGKGDHKHVGGREFSYTFVSVEQLTVDFWADVAAWG